MCTIVPKLRGGGKGRHEVSGTFGGTGHARALVRQSDAQRRLTHREAARESHVLEAYELKLERPEVITVARQGQGKSETARIAIEPRSYGTQEIELPDIAQANPSPADLQRNARERILLAKVFKRKEGSPRFTLPLGKPANPLPEGKSFGVDRIFNGKPAAQPHMGSDYPVPAGAPVLAVADGTVVLAQDLFYPGNAVFVDHGDGLVSMYFHLSAIDVQAGQEVRKGDRIGQVGTTGRSTGPHLFFGIRWHNARIDPRFVLEDPARIPAL